MRDRRRKREIGSPWSRVAFRMRWKGGGRGGVLRRRAHEVGKGWGKEQRARRRRKQGSGSGSLRRGMGLLWARQGSRPPSRAGDADRCRTRTRAVGPPPPPAYLALCRSPAHSPSLSRSPALTLLSPALPLSLSPPLSLPPSLPSPQPPPHPLTPHLRHCTLGVCVFLYVTRRRARSTTRTNPRS